VHVTRLGFGGSGIGGAHRLVTDSDAAAAVDAAWNLGVRYFDTAPRYGAGLGERRLGAALAGRQRSSYAISTKVGLLIDSSGALVHDYTRDGVLRSLEASRERTGLDRFDVVFVHDPEDHLDVALAEALPALAALRDEGAIGAIGAGMNLVEPLREMVRDAEPDVVMLAGRWTLVDRSARELLDECAARGVAVIAAAPFNSGLLAEPEPRADATFDYLPAPAALLERARACAAICRRHGVELPAAALQFPLRHPAVAAVVAGVCDAAESAAAVDRMNAPVPNEAWRELDALTQPVY
jgi:D-threo-aldose 1-dehydrogenase